MRLVHRLRAGARSGRDARSSQSCGRARGAREGESTRPVPAHRDRPQFWRRYRWYYAPLHGVMFVLRAMDVRACCGKCIRATRSYESAPGEPSIRGIICPVAREVPVSFDEPNAVDACAADVGAHARVWVCVSGHLTRGACRQAGTPR